MRIQNMFADDINRTINGVIKVDQSTDDVLYQEVKEYVITKELKKHFISFFNYYDDAFDTPTSDIGVWISGFFGSGKSHFLKMLSYILENKEVEGKRTVEYFRDKFADDPATFMLVDKAAKAPTETILFNIDIEGPMQKDKTAVLRVFAKMFYNHLGFFGDNLKVARLEQYIDSLGKAEEFRRVFQEKKGKPWLEQRKAFAFNGKSIIPTMMEVLDMSEADASSWFRDKSEVEFSIAQLVQDIKDYVSKKPDDFRLLFMVDEVGQYVGTDTDMLLNLQSIVEKIGSDCGGKVWVACTGQEAIDEIIKVRSDEFSRIQARFKTRLSLSSSSVDEVIQKRILRKKDDVTPMLEKVYDKTDSVLRNLFTFTDSVLDIKGFSGATEFAQNFPFVPYQFILMQKVFAEIRKHGNSGKHLSGGERSMLSGFQEVAQKIQTKDEYALAPFYMFYDTVHTFLDSTIRRVIERCQKAEDNHDGIEQQDVAVLKLLYLIRYIDDVKANLDNIVILMANDIRVDKITMRQSVQESLDRLLSQNYIGRTGDAYNFLTDEEQDIQREIKNTPVDTNAIVTRIATTISTDIYQNKKYRYGKQDFEFDQMVDNVTVGKITGGMLLKFLTVATDATEKNELSLVTDSKDKAIVVLADTPYYESLETAMKIRKYVKQRNVSQLPKSVQDIIRSQNDEATKLEDSSKTELIRAIEGAEFYVDEAHLQIKSGTAKNKIDQVLEYLVSHIYSNLNLITKNYESDADIAAILNGSSKAMSFEMEPNSEAAVDLDLHLEMQAERHLPTSMADIQSRYSAAPYGWREIDIAAVAALLVSYQKVTIKYAGTTIQPSDPRLPDMLRRKTEIGKTSIMKRIKPKASQMREVREFLRDYCEVMDVPDDEDGLIQFIVEHFEAQKEHYEKLKDRYVGHQYPDKALVNEAISLMESILSQRKDNIALLTRVLEKEDDLYDNKDDMVKVEDFFKTQVVLFDSAVDFERNLRTDQEYLKENKEANEALNKIRLITMVGNGKFDYKQIPVLNVLMEGVKDVHDQMLDKKRDEVLEIVRQCLEVIHTKAEGNDLAEKISHEADDYYRQQKTKIQELEIIALLDGLIQPIFSYKDKAVKRIKAYIHPAVTKPSKPTLKTDEPVKPKENIRKVYLQSILTKETLRSEEDIDRYLADLRKKLEQRMAGVDGIELS